MRSGPNFSTISGMRTIARDQRGSTALLVALLLTIILLIGAVSFGIWAYAGRQDYKNNVQPKISAAVEEAKKQTERIKDDEFTQKEKYPLKTYNGLAAYGSPTVSYSKTWSAYVVENTSSTPIDAYFHPNFVPTANQTNSFALRMQIVQTPYDALLKQFDAFVKQGKVKVTAYAAPKVSQVVGARLDGEIIPNKQGSMVLLPLRDKTLKVWTEASQYVPDFNNIILPNLTFNP